MSCFHLLCGIVYQVTIHYINYFDYIEYLHYERKYLGVTSGALIDYNFLD